VSYVNTFTASALNDAISATVVTRCRPLERLIIVRCFEKYTEGGLCLVSIQ